MALPEKDELQFAKVEVLTLRFQKVPQELVENLNRLTDLKRLKELYRQAIIAGSLEEFEHFAEAKEGK